MCGFANLLPCLGTTANFVELDEEEIVFSSSNYDVCVILNASSGITETTLVVLTLTILDGERAVVLSIGNASVTISPPNEPGNKGKLYSEKVKNIFSDTCIFHAIYFDSLFLFSSYFYSWGCGFYDSSTADNDRNLCCGCVGGWMV